MGLDDERKFDYLAAAEEGGGLGRDGMYLDLSNKFNIIRPSVEM